LPYENYRFWARSKTIDVPEALGQRLWARALQSIEKRPSILSDRHV